MVCPQESCPSAWLFKVPLFRTLSTCGWQEGRNEHIPCLRLAFLGDVCKINGLVALLPHLPHLWSIKETGFQTTIPPIRWSFEVLDCRLLRQPALQLKSLPCLNHCLSGSLACHVMCRANLHLVTEGWHSPPKDLGSQHFRGKAATMSSATQRPR